ncbi:hypothetical protein SLA2020_508000 [Shorea laevis]
MLDLNLSMEVLVGEKPPGSSGSFDSSVVIVETAADHDDNTIGYNFSILKSRREDGAVGASEYSQDGRTIPFFPVASEGRVGKSTSTSSSRRPWLNLGCREVEHDGTSDQKKGAQQHLQLRQQVWKSRRGPRSRSSQYRGVTFYRRTGRWESHIWDCGKQVYLGGFDTAHAAARAYDRAAIKFRGVDADINFNISDYNEDINQMSNFTKEEFVHVLRRQSNGFSKGSSKNRGVTQHKDGQWEARMELFLGKNGYDKATICNGREAVTNFERSTYEVELPLGSENGNHILDLNLGIAPPYTSEAERKNVSRNQIPFQQSWNHLPIDRGTRLENSASATRVQQPSYRYHQAMAFYPPIWRCPNPNFFPSLRREQDREEDHESRFLTKCLARARARPYDWASPVPPFPTAASSGFSSSSVTLPPDASTPRFPTTTFHDNFSAAPLTNLNNTSH